jgi:hypothetical protein
MPAVLLGALLAWGAAGGENVVGRDNRNGEVPRLLVQDQGPEGGAGKKAARPLNTIQDVFHALEACWIPPVLDHARPGMQITVLLSFKRNGELNGHPRITYETPGATDEQRLAYRLAMAEAITRCTPLPFTDSLGNALAGRPMTMRFIDNRNLKQAGFQNGRDS